MTHHKRRAYPPKQTRPQPWTTSEQVRADMAAAMEAARDRLIEQMTNPPRTYIWLTRNQYNQYVRLLNGATPDPDIRLIEQDTDA